MKHFIYTYSESRSRNGHTQKTVKLYRVTRNAPKLLGTLTETFVDQNQLVMMAMEEFKALPKSVFERHPMGGFAHTPWSLKNAGIATINQL